MERKENYIRRKILSVPLEISRGIWKVLGSKEKVTLRCWLNDVHARYMYIEIALSDGKDADDSKPSTIDVKTLMVGSFSDGDMAFHFPSRETFSLANTCQWSCVMKDNRVVIKAICSVSDLVPMVCDKDISYIVERGSYNIIRNRQPNLVLLCIENGIKPTPNVISLVVTEMQRIRDVYNQWIAKNNRVKKIHIHSVLEMEVKNPLRDPLVDIAYQWSLLIARAHCLTYREEWDRVRGSLERNAPYLDRFAYNYWMVCLALPSEDALLEKQLKPTSNVLIPLLFHDDRKKIVIGYVEEENIDDVGILISRLSCPKKWDIHALKKYMKLLFSYRIERVSCS
jgi:hypothetical protein